jgi:hypothetical protein
MPAAQRKSPRASAPSPPHPWPPNPLPPRNKLANKKVMTSSKFKSTGRVAVPSAHIPRTWPLRRTRRRAQSARAQPWSSRTRRRVPHRLASVKRTMRAPNPSQPRRLLSHGRLRSHALTSMRVSAAQSVQTRPRPKQRIRANALPTILRTDPSRWQQSCRANACRRAATPRRPRRPALHRPTPLPSLLCNNLYLQRHHQSLSVRTRIRQHKLQLPKCRRHSATPPWLLLWMHKRQCPEEQQCKCHPRPCQMRGGRASGIQHIRHKQQTSGGRGTSSSCFFAQPTSNGALVSLRHSLQSKPALLHSL